MSRVGGGDTVQVMHPARRKCTQNTCGVYSEDARIRAGDNQRKETFVKRSGKIRVDDVVMVLACGLLLRVMPMCAGWREHAGSGHSCEGMPEFRAAA